MKLYAPYGSESFNLYIDGVIKSIAKRFEKLFSRDELSALILGGGYGRGEGGVLHLADGTEKLYNDLDFFVISKQTNPWKNSQISLKLKHLHHELSDEYGVEVDFSACMPINSLDKLPPYLIWYDLINGYQVIWGNKHALHTVPRWEANDLEPVEAVKLLLNRGMGLYFSRKYLSLEKPEPHLDFINRNIHKAYQAMTEAILIVEGQYHWSVKERMRLISIPDIGKYLSNPAFLDLAQAGMDFKLKPYLPTESPEELKERLSQTLIDFEELYYAVWAAFFGVSNLNLDTYHRLLASYKDSENSLMSLAKNFALNLRDIGLSPSSLNEYIKYPRYRLFYALPWLLFDAPISLSNLAPILGLAHGADAESLRQRYVSLWQRYN